MDYENTVGTSDWSDFWNVVYVLLFDTKETTRPRSISAELPLLLVKHHINRHSTLFARVSTMQYSTMLLSILIRNSNMVLYPTGNNLAISLVFLWYMCVCVCSKCLSRKSKCYVGTGNATWWCQIAFYALFFDHSHLSLDDNCILITCLCGRWMVEEKIDVNVSG